MVVEKEKIVFGIGLVLKGISYFLALIMLLTFGLLIYWWLKSPGKMIQYVDDQGKVLENSIASKEYVELNGTKLGMIIKSRDLSNPVLLFIHGGVGMPEYPMTYKYPTGLEDEFTVVWLEQRGAGLSFDSEIKPEELVTEQYISDIIEVSKYLRQRFNTEKIYLMAMSAGTYAGIQAAAKAPELYEAYIGMSQVVNEEENRALAYEYLVDYFTKLNKVNKVKKLNKAYGTKNFGRIITPLMCEAGIETTREMKSQATGIFLPSMECPEYTLGEKINIWRGLILGKQSAMSHEIKHVDMNKLVTKLEIPVYFFSGQYDYITNYQLVEKYMQNISAPLKGYYLFEDSAHSPFFEEPERVMEVMKHDVKNKVKELAR